jgi:hypothetical protein
MEHSALCCPRYAQRYRLKNIQFVDDLVQVSKSRHESEFCMPGDHKRKDSPLDELNLKRTKQMNGVPSQWKGKQSMAAKKLVIKAFKG